MHGIQTIVFCMASIQHAQPNLAALRGEIAARQISKRAIAALLGISESLFSLYITGKRPAPADFETQVRWAMAQLEEEKRVAAEAVERLRAERAAQDADGERL